MKETNFIKQNHEKWERLEKAITNPNEKADELSDLFIQVTDDLSYSRTFYPNRSIRAYLNWLSQRLFFKIYRAKKLKKNAFAHFWTEELPQIMYESRWEVLLAFLVFVVSVLIGALSQAMDPEFANTILGPDYVDQTIHNIEKGDPMAIYKSSGPVGMSLGIIANNLYVALRAFMLGVFASIGSIGSLISNGVMVGVFQYFFYEHRVFGESFLGIWTHGALEISAIILAGAAGIVMGKGLLFPGTYHRLKAFQITAQRGLKIYLGIAPIIVIAGLIEGFITRLTNTPDIIRLLFILGCFGFMIGYFVIYPIVKHRRGFTAKIPEPFLQPDNDAPINFNPIKKSGTIFMEVLILFRRHAGIIVRFSAMLSAIFVAILFLSNGSMQDIFFFRKYFWSAITSLQQFLNFDHLFPYLNGAAFAGIAWKANRIIAKERHQPSAPLLKSLPLWLLGILPAMAFQYALVLAGSFGLTLLVLPVIIPIILSIAIGIYYTKPNPFAAFIKGPRLVFKHLDVEIMVNLILIPLSFLIISLASSSVLYSLIYLFGMSFQNGTEWFNSLVPILFAFLTEFLILSTLFGFIFGATLTWFSAKEITEANHLRKAIDNIGTEQRIKGMLRE